MRTLAALVFVALLAGGAYLLSRSAAPVQGPGMQTYSNDAYGISFSYPERYVLQARAGSDRYTVTLIEKTALENIPADGEGPTAITIDFFDNPKNLSPEAWVRSSSASNFQLSVDTQLRTDRVAASDAIAYSWDGLYRADSYVVAHNGRIVMLSGTYLASDDLIRQDFTSVLHSIQLK